MSTLMQDLGTSLVVTQGNATHRYGMTDDGRLYVEVEYQGARLQRVSLALQPDSVLMIRSWLERETKRTQPRSHRDRV